MWIRPWLKTVSHIFSFIFLSFPGYAAEPEVKPDPAKVALEVFAGFGLPSFNNFGLNLYLGEKKDICLRLQTGAGTMSGDVSYDDQYKELLFLANRTKEDDKWSTFVGAGIGNQEISVQTDYTENGGTRYREQETFKKTYLKFNVGIVAFADNGFTLGSDFGLTYPVNISSVYSANENAQGTDIPMYNATRKNFDLVKSLFATGITIQFNLIRLGWHF